MREERCYLVHINLGGQPSKSRIGGAANEIKTIIEALSTDYRLVYTSGDGRAFGFIVVSSLVAPVIADRINSPGRFEVVPTKGSPPSPLRTEDSMLVLELGSDFAGIHMSAVLPWLQHRSPQKTTAPQSAIAPAADLGQSQLANQLAAIKDKICKP